MKVFFIYFFPVGAVFSFVAVNFEVHMQLALSVAHLALSVERQEPHFGGVCHTGNLSLPRRTKLPLLLRVDSRRSKFLDRE